MKTIGFFDDRGRVARASLVYHLSWMFAEMGLRVVAADLDPRANLTSMFVDDERLEELWPQGSRRATLFGALSPLLDGAGDVEAPHVEDLDLGLGLLVGDPALSSCEDTLTSGWAQCLEKRPEAFRVISAVGRVIERAALEREADVVLVDVGPGLGALNRAALLAADHVVVPLAPDLHSLQALRNVGPALRRWRGEWAERRELSPDPGLCVPFGGFLPAGYVLMRNAVRLGRSSKASERSADRIPSAYREWVLGEVPSPATFNGSEDPHRLAAMRHYPSLDSIAQEARKPMFLLRPADGAVGGLARAVQDCYADFRVLAAAVAGRCGIPLPGR